MEIKRRPWIGGVGGLAWLGLLYPNAIKLLMSGRLAGVIMKMDSHKSRNFCSTETVDTNSSWRVSNMLGAGNISQSRCHVPDSRGGINIFPTIARMARDDLAIPATSV